MKRYGVLLAILLAWELLGAFLPTQTNYIPLPHQVLVALIEQLKGIDIYLDSFLSVEKVLVGFIAASFVGICGGLLLGYFTKAGKYVRPVIELLRPIPPIAYIPIAILLFGLGNLPAYFIVFVGGFFPIFTNTYISVISLPRVYKDVVSSFELSKSVYVSKILFPYCLPGIFTGLKIGMGTAWMSVIAAELVSGQSGLGYFIQINRLLLRVDNVLVGMVLIGLIGYLLNGIISSIERKVVIWRG